MTQFKIGNVVLTRLDIPHIWNDDTGKPAGSTGTITGINELKKAHMQFYMVDIEGSNCIIHERNLIRKPFVLWDIDNTIYHTYGSDDGDDVLIRPYFKQLFDATSKHYEHRFYTAANSVHVFHVCCILRDYGFDVATCKMLYDTALTRDNCPSERVEKQGTYHNEVGELQPYTYSIDEKLLEKACKMLKCELDDIHVHIDDHPDCNKWEHQSKRLMCPPYEGDIEDTYFYRLLEHYRATGSLK
jgi:DNA-binding transcriptional MerR regulator